jgi:hypothetical protein
MLANHEFSDVLDRLGVLVGTWSIEAISPANPTTPVGSGRCTMEWTLGKRFVAQRTVLETAQAPRESHTLIAVERTGARRGALTQSSYDERGVEYRYEMTLDGTTWTLLREPPDGVAERFTASIDGDVIRGTWEKAESPGRWQKDHDLVYRRIR